MSLLTIEKINNLYGNNYDIYYTYNNNKNQFIKFIKYCYHFFISKGNIHIFIKKIVNFMKNKPSDSKFIIFFRNIVINVQTVEEFKKKGEQYYKPIMDSKVNQMRTFLKDYNIVSIMDIGTENLYFLTKLKKSFNLKLVKGINIDDGFSHYSDIEFKNLINNDKFTLYDGWNLPFKNEKYDLVVFIAVIHHMTDKNIHHLLSQLKSRTKYIYISDHDLIDRSTKSLFIFQHQFWSNTLFPSNDMTYINDTITISKLTYMMKKHNFHLEKIEKKPSFHRRFKALYVNKNLNI